jgi:hypothetical protein
MLISLPARVRTAVVIPLLIVGSAVASVTVATPHANAATAHGVGTWGTIVNWYGKCLDDTNYGTNAGNQMQDYSCNGKATQHWEVYAEPQVNGATDIMWINQQSGLCLDQYQGRPGKVIQWPCNTSDQAQWWYGDQMNTCVNGNGCFPTTISNQASGAYLEGSSVNGTRVVTLNVQPPPSATSGWGSWASVPY